MAYRMNISIPETLRQRIEGVEQRINWSAVAAKAFEEKLNSLSLEMTGCGVINVGFNTTENEHASGNHQ